MFQDAGSVRPSGDPPYWQPGDVINWRYRRRSSRPLPESVAPVTVVRDDASGLAAWLAEGTPMWTVGRVDGRGVREVELAERFHGERVQTTGRWQGPGVLRVAPTGASWSVWHFRDATGSNRGWYVNLERPHARDAHNVIRVEHQLGRDGTRGPLKTEESRRAIDIPPQLMRRLVALTRPAGVELDVVAVEGSRRTGGEAVAARRIPAAGPGHGARGAEPGDLVG